MARLFIYFVQFVLVWTIPALADTIVITNGKILTAGPQGTLANGSIILKDGLITEIGTTVKVPDNARIIDAAGKTITPGFVASNTNLTTVEVNGGADANDSGTSSLNMSAAYDVQDALDPASSLISVARRAGVTRAIVIPTNIGRAPGREALFSGQPAVIQLGAGKSMLVQSRAGIYMYLGRRGANNVGGGRGASLSTLKHIIDDVRLYARKKDAYENGKLRPLALPKADLDALVPMVQGKIPLVVNVNRASDILKIMEFGEAERIKLIIEGAAEGWRVAEQIAKAKVPVILDAPTNLPSNFDMLAATINNPARLYEAGVTIVIRGGSDGHAVDLLRINAGIAVANGLPYDAALKAITVNPARIWGQKSFGQIREGQAADLVIWSGDPFEPLSSAQTVFINGEEQSLITRQTLLRDKYLPN